MDLKARLIAIAGLIVLALGVAACGDDGGGSSDQEQITISIPGDPRTLDPHKEDDANFQPVLRNVYDSLVARNPDGSETLPGLAESWERVDPTTWRLKLREGVKFHDGEPFDAEAAAFNINRMLDSDYASGQSSYVAGLKGARALGDYELEVTTQGPDPSLLGKLYWIPIASPAGIEAGSFDSQMPAGTGPYQFDAYRRGQDLTLTRNEKYWGDAEDLVKDVTFRIVSDSGSAIASLQSGEIDLVIGLEPDSADSVPVTKTAPSIETAGIRLNQIKGPLTDRALRQAMNYAVDKQAIVDSIRGGYSSIAGGQMVPDTSLGYNPDVKAYPYDPEKAKQLIASAGAEGTEFVLAAPTGLWPNAKEVTEIVAQDLRKVGLKPVTRFQPIGQFVGPLLDPSHPLDAAYLVPSDDLLDTRRVLENNFTCEGPQATYCNPEVERLMKQAQNAPDEKAAADLYRQVNAILNEDAAWLFLDNPEALYGASERLDWSPRADQFVLVKDMKLGN